MIINPRCFPRMSNWWLLLGLLPEAGKLKEYAALAKDGLDKARDVARELGKEHGRKFAKNRERDAQ